MGPLKTQQQQQCAIFVLVCSAFLVGNIQCETPKEDNEVKPNQEKEESDGSGSQGIYDFMISTKALSTIPFHGSDLIIYEHPNNVATDKMHHDNRFYVMPVVEIDIRSLEVFYSWITGAYRLDFMLVLWTDELKTAAIEDIETLYGSTDDELEEQRHLSLNQIQMIPMEEVRLIWNSEVPLPDGIWLSRDWIPFSRNPHQLKFSFMCEKELDCDRLKMEMTDNPGEFRKLNLEFTTTVKSGASREIQISGSTLTSSKIFRDLLSQDKFPGGEQGIRYLTAEDLQNLAIEVTENYVAKVTTDATYVPTQQSLSVAELIYNRLASTKESTARMTEKAWNSLKWEPDFARPDRVTSQLNDVTNVVKSTNNSTYLRINQTAFDSAAHNLAYASEFNKLSLYRGRSGSARASVGACSRSSYRRGSGGGFTFFGIGGGRSGSSSSSRSACVSLFNSVSSRSVTDLDAYGSETNLEKTSVAKSGLNNWQVGGDAFNDYLSDQSSYIQFDGEKFVHKPMDLYKLTVTELTENVRILTTDIQVQQMQKIYHIKTSVSSDLTSSYVSDIDMINKKLEQMSKNITQSATTLKEEQAKELQLIRDEYTDDILSVSEAITNDHNALREIQESMHLNMNTSIEDMHNTISSSIENIHLTLNTSIGDLNDQHLDFKEDISQDIEFLHNATQRLDSGDVAFMVTSTITQTTNRPIFNSVKLNRMDGYSTATGKFTAPVDGLYLFYYGLKTSTKGIAVYLYMGGTHVYFSDSYYVSYSGTAMGRLSKDETAYVGLGSTYTVHGGLLTFFGGHLISED